MKTKSYFMVVVHQVLIFKIIPQFGTKIYISVQIHAGFSYLTINQKEEKRIDSLSPPQSGVLIDYGLSLNHIEQDLINLEGTGIEWVSNSIPFASSQPIILI